MNKGRTNSRVFHFNENINRSTTGKNNNNKKNLFPNSLLLNIPEKLFKTKIIPALLFMICIY